MSQRHGDRMQQHGSWYERKLLPHLLDFACGLSPIRQQRLKVVPQAAGRVLEIGIGTGLNLPFYDRRKVRSLVGIDPSPELHAKARRRSERAGLPVELRAVTAEQLPLESRSFDCVVCTYTLCTVADPEAALAQMRRVLRPGGALLLLEHGLAPDASVERWQRRIEPYWSPVAGGCRLTRDVPALLRAAGFIGALETGYIARPKALAYNVWGRATAP